MPSVWNFVGVEPRTALTAFVFHVSTASGGIATGLRPVAEAIGSDAVAAATTKLARTSRALNGTFLRFMSSPLGTRPPRRRGWAQGPRAARRAQPPGLRGRRR